MYRMPSRLCFGFRGKMPVCD